MPHIIVLSQAFRLGKGIYTESSTAGCHVRWAATPGGNLALLINPKYYLESDFATVLAGAGGKVKLSFMHGPSM